MKKWLAIIAVLSVIIIGALAVTACGDDPLDDGAPVEHVHISDSYDITRNATCTADGAREGVCTVCGETFTDTIPALGHDDSIVIPAVPAACEAGGFTEGKSCSRCGEVVAQPKQVPAIGHDWHFQSEKAATCTEAGEATYACAACFAVEDRTVPALGHNGNVVIPAVRATCESVGFTAGKGCSRCGEVVAEPKEIPATGHDLYYEKRSNDTHAVYCENCNYSEIADCEFEEVEVAPTCTEAGKLLHTCTVCGDNHEHETYAALGHLMTTNWTFYKTVDGTYKHRQTCYRCEYYKEEDCSAVAMSTEVPTCQTIGYTVYECGDCGNTYNSDFKDALGHDWSAYEIDEAGDDPYSHTHKRHCLRNACTAEEKGIPVGTVGTVIGMRTDETCENDAYTRYTCSLVTCTYTHTEIHDGSALGHSFGVWEYSGDGEEHHEHTHRCLRSNCNKEESNDCRMTTSSQAATCTKPEIEVSVCADCFYVDRDEFPALGHKWSAWINVRDMDGILRHTHVCTVCGLREYGFHSYEITTVPADCDHDETIVNTCSVCGYSASTTVAGSALGHEWEVVSCDLGGHSLVCNRYEVAHEITAPHDYSASNLCTYCHYDGLTYELAVTGDYFIVKNDNGVPRASEITVASLRPNPAYVSGASESETLPVRSIGASAFLKNTVITKVNLPATITSIESNAFEGCTKLAAVEFYGGGSQLTRVEYGAFYNCSALTAIALPATLKAIGNIAFSGCTKLNNLVIPESVAEIGVRALYNTAYYNDGNNWVDGALYAGLHLIRVNAAYFTETVTDFTVKNGTITVSEHAFEGCIGMRKISIPASVKTIGNDAFFGCEDLNEVEYGGGVSDWFAITFVSTMSSPMYYATQMNILGEINSELTLPENITSIPAGTFKGNTCITKVTIPAKVTSIGDEAFMGCVNLTHIDFENDRVTYMGKNAFLNTGFYADGGNWDGGVLILGNHILATSADLDVDEYVIADNIRTVSSGAFAERAISNITLGTGLVWFGASAFDIAALQNVTFKNTSGAWFAKNIGGAVRSVSVTADAVANALLLRNYPGEWRKV